MVTTKNHYYDPFTKEEWNARLSQFHVGQNVINFNLGLRGTVTKVTTHVHFTDQYGREIRLDPFTVHAF